MITLISAIYFYEKWVYENAVICFFLFIPQFVILWKVQKMKEEWIRNKIDELTLKKLEKEMNSK